MIELADNTGLSQVEAVDDTVAAFLNRCLFGFVWYWHAYLWNWFIWLIDLFEQLIDLLVSGKQEAPRVCNDVSEHAAEDHRGVQRARSVAASGGSALNHGDDDDHPECCREVKASAQSPASSSTTTPVHGLVNCVQHNEEDCSSKRFSLFLSWYDWESSRLCN